MRKLLYLIPLFFALTACEKAFLDKDVENDPETNFELLWSTLDQKYSFFTYKNIDWDSIYSVYRPQVTPNTTELELFDLMADMLYQLEDGHVNLSSAFDVSRNWDWFLDSPQNFNYTIIEREYLGQDHRISGPLLHQVIDSVGYVYYGSFGRTVSNTSIDLVISRFQNLKGMIIDVRDNGGGSPTNAFRICSRIADQRRLVYYEEFKNGPGHDDFDARIPVHVSPEGPQQFTKPVILLTNRSSYSATTFFAAMMAAFPHVTIMGDSTGGGGGTPTGSELPNGWFYRYSATQTIMPNGINIEGGVPVDVRVDMDPLLELSDVDSILERALQELR